MAESPVAKFYSWVLGQKDAAQRLAYRSLSKLFVGTKRNQEADAPGNMQGIPAGKVCWPVDPETHDGASFIGADCFLAYYDAASRQVFCLDDWNGTRHQGARPLKVGKNVTIASGKKRSGKGVVYRTAEYGTAGLLKNVFIPVTSELIAHHRAPKPPNNSSQVHDPGEGNDDWEGGLHYPLRVRRFVAKFCSSGHSVTGDEPELFAPLFNMRLRNGDGTDAGGAATFARGEAALSDEAKGPLACANDNNHLLGYTKDASVNQGAIHIDGLYGPIGGGNGGVSVPAMATVIASTAGLTDKTTSSGPAPVPIPAPAPAPPAGLYMPKEHIDVQWEPGSKGPLIKRVEHRPDFNDKHTNYCGKKVKGVLKWQTWADIAEYPPSPPTVPPPIVPPPIVPPPEDPPRIKVPNPIIPPEEPPDPRNPVTGPKDGSRPSAAGPAEIEVPSTYHHAAPALADGYVTTRSGATANDRFWLGKYGFSEKEFIESPVVGHEVAIPVYESASPNSAQDGAARWPTVKSAEAEYKMRGDRVISRDKLAKGPGSVVDMPSNLDGGDAFIANEGRIVATPNDFTRIVLAGKTALGITIDGRTGLGRRIHTTGRIASGLEIKQTYSGDGTTSIPDAAIYAKDPNAADDALGTAKLSTNYRLKTEVGRIRKTTDTTGGLTLDATHHVVRSTGAGTITLPATVVAGTEFEYINSHSAAITIARNGNTINGAAADFSVAAGDRVFITGDSDAGGWRIHSVSPASAGGTYVTAAATLQAANRVPVATGNTRAVAASDFTMTQDGTNVISVAAGTGIAFDSKNFSNIGTIASAAMTTTVADEAAPHSYGVNSTKGPWTVETVVDFLSSGGGAGQTVFDIPIGSTNSSGLIIIEAFGVRVSGSARRFQYRAEVGVGENGGTYVKDGENITTNRNVGGLAAVLTTAISTSNLRITLDDGGTAIQLGLNIKKSFRNLTA